MTAASSDRGEKEKTPETDSTTNGALVKRRSELQRSLHLSLPGSVVLPECRPEGPPPAEHKAVKRFNSIRAAERRAGRAAARRGFIEFNASAGFALWKSPARITLPQRFNARAIRFRPRPP